MKKFLAAAIIAASLLFNQSAYAFLSTEAEWEELKLNVENLLLHKDNLDTKQRKYFTIFYSNMSADAHHLEKYELALFLANAAIEFNPNDEWYWEQRGKTYMYFKEYDKALADYNKAIELEPNYETYFKRALAYHYLEQYEAAVADYSKTIELNPKADGAYKNRGICYDAMGETEKAAADFAKAEELRNED